MKEGDRNRQNGEKRNRAGNLPTNSCVHLVVAVNCPSNLPTAACDCFPKGQALVTVVTSCCIGILVVELQSALGPESLS